MKKITFIHAADLHIDSPMVGLKYLPAAIFKRLQESTFKALHSVIDNAIKYHVDFVIFAGDLFDGEDRSLRAQIRLKTELQRLAEHDIQAFIIHGNHDHLNGVNNKISYSENVYVFKDQIETKSFRKKDGTMVHLYGFSYPERHVLENKVYEYTKSLGADFHIGILHGHFEGSSEHGRYAPFKLIDLYEKGFDYWALGHIHKRMVLSDMPPVVYPGNTQGRNKKELGEKGCYLVELSESGCELTFIETADIIWKDTRLDGSQINEIGELHKICRNEIMNHRVSGKGLLLSVTIENVSSEKEELLEFIRNGELLEILQEEEEYENSFVWTYSLRARETIERRGKTLMDRSEFVAEILTTSNHYKDINMAAAPLYNHPSARKYLEGFSEGEQRVLIKEAEEILLNLLSRID